MSDRIEFTADVMDGGIIPSAPLRVGDEVRVLAKPGTFLPAGLVAGNRYIVVTSHGRGIGLAGWRGGPPIHLTSSGAGVIDHEGTT